MNKTCGWYVKPGQECGKPVVNPVIPKGPLAPADWQRVRREACYCEEHVREHTRRQELAR